MVILLVNEPGWRNMKNLVATLLLSLALPCFSEGDEAKVAILQNDETSTTTIIRASGDAVVVSFTNKNSYPVVVALLDGVLQRKHGDAWESLESPSGWICGTPVVGVVSSLQVDAGKTVELKFSPGSTRELINLQKGDEIRFSFVHQKLEKDAPTKNRFERMRVAISNTFRIEANASDGDKPSK